MSAPKRTAVKATSMKAARRPKSSRTGPAEPTAAADDDASAAAKKLAAEIDSALARGDIELLSPDAVQTLMAAVCRTYSTQVESGGKYLPLPDGSRVTSTDVMVTASGLLRSANLAVFELGMWQSWTGR